MISSEFAFKSSTLGLSQSVKVRDYGVDVDREFYSLYVYCNLCEPQFVGAERMSLLGTVDAKGRDKHMMTKTYNQPHHGLDNNYVIEINLKNEREQDLSFVTEKVVCKSYFVQTHDINDRNINNCLGNF